MWENVGFASTNLVFSYGTLIDKFPDRIVHRAELRGKYTIDDSGYFPCLYMFGNKTIIQGQLLELCDDELKEADYYEDQDGLYTRKLLTVHVNNEPKTAWVYITN